MSKSKGSNSSDAFRSIFQSLQLAELRWRQVQEGLGASRGAMGVCADFKSHELLNAQFKESIQDLGLKVFQLYQLNELDHLIYPQELSVAPPVDEAQVSPAVALEAPPPQIIAAPTPPVEPTPPVAPVAEVEPIAEVTPPAEPIAEPVAEAADVEHFKALFNAKVSGELKEEVVETPSVVVDLVQAHEIWRDVSEDTPVEIDSISAFSREYSRVQSLIGKNYFVSSWRNLSTDIMIKIYHYIRARVEYLKSVSRRHRPSHAQGDGALDSLLRELNDKISVVDKEALNSRLFMQNNWKNTILLLKNELDDYFLSPPKSKKALAKESFNPERALDELDQLVSNDEDGTVVRDFVLNMLKNGMSYGDVRLISMLPRYVDLLEGSELRQLRSKIRKFDRKLEEYQSNLKTTEEYINSSSFIDKKITLVGGDRRQDLLNWLNKILPNSKIDWVETSRNGGTRQVDSLVDSINYGGVDYVLIILSFLSHKISKKVMDAAQGNPHGVQAEYVIHGYGRVEILNALDRCLAVSPALEL